MGLFSSFMYTVMPAGLEFATKYPHILV